MVVIGRNEGARLVRCLESVRAADYPQEKIELIYADTDSTDDSCTVAAKAGAEVVPIRPERPCAAAARNAGLRRAHHELVHFFDGDTMVVASWFRRGVAAMKDPNVACVFGRVTEVAPTASVYNFWAHHDWYVPPGPADSCGGNALYLHDALEIVGGFDESLIAGEEPDLCYRIREGQGKLVMSLDQPMIQHDINMTRFAQYWRRCTRTGHGYAEIAHRHPGLRSWRIAHRREPAHVLVGLAALALSLGFWTPWPVAVWAGLLAAAVLRNAMRVRNRVGGFRSAILYSVHHYIAKLPITIGECTYWFRLFFRRHRQPLMEYR